jgi:mRNA interferase RelE/StbE
MAWTIEFSEQADRDLAKLDPQHSRRILRFLENRIAKLEDPRAMGKPLQGSRFGELWRYRTGDFRILCKIEDEILVVVVIRIGRRKQIYR